MFVYDSNENLIGEVHQIWHLWRRKYDLFVDRTQFARIDAPFLSWDFDIQGPSGEILGNVNRNFVGFAREVGESR
ncbi:hypothetical protein M427DRAFT_432509 [Gonapodya prolifera JEL478]|uniref:Phospholipid scramblase n=1 Tax=Gonapodya prolifera (strain JEL478) TaxID=1344416 RepID=A0A139AT24_GONPJ|nr:hypothetical protein M427DRAFT_432509 [Gonapodya prolifera JEL478]|eukprot:KXS19886.1 hypothetical protein M427DRAFT_432509 [Gonapodya prolifera JEL478]